MYLDNIGMFRGWRGAAIVFISWLWCTGVMAPSVARAENGDLLAIHETLNGTDLVDIARDTSDGTFWILGADGSSLENHSLYHLAADLETELGTFSNPHPQGDIASSTLTVNRGLAFRTLSNTLLVLASVGPRLDQRYSLREVSRTGEEVGADITLQPQDDDANLFGLSYDLLSRQVWALDARHDKVLRFALDGTLMYSFLLPGKEPPSTQLRGEGIGFALEQIEPKIYVAYGDIFSAVPTRLLQLRTEGVLQDDQLIGDPTGVEVPLLQVPATRIRGFQTFQTGLAGSEKRAAVIGDGGTIYEIEQTISTPLPPTELSCSLTLDNQVLIRWKNNGPSTGGVYNGGIQVLRNDSPLVSLPGDTVEFLDETPVDGTATYALRGSETSGGAFSDWSHPCQVTVGVGGLIDWAPFPGTSIFGITENPSTGEIFATDDLLGTILVFDEDLNPTGEVASPWPNPGGIAFVPSITLGFPPQTFNDVLAVTEASGNRLRIINPASPAGSIITTMTLRFDEVADPRIAGLSYVATAGEFVLVERGSELIYRFTTGGAQVDACRPLDFLVGGARPTRGVTYDPILDTLQVVFTGGLVREVVPGGSCPPTEFTVPLAGLGPGSQDPSFAGGIQISANTLLVCGRQLNALFRILLFPFSPDFVRGDFNRDAEVNLSDAVATANYLFNSGVFPSCSDAADANDDGVIDISDPVFLLFHLFVPQSPPPPSPFPEPGSDPTFRDNLGCVE